jgi:hypothetical protein
LHFRFTLLPPGDKFSQRKEKHMPILDYLEKVADADVQEISEKGARIVNGLIKIENRVSEDDLDHGDASRAFDQLFELVTMFLKLGKINPAALAAPNAINQIAGATNTSAPALTGGSTAPANADDIVLTGDAAAAFRALQLNRTPEQTVAYLYGVFQPLTALGTSDQGIARLSVIESVADGTIKVKDDSQLQFKADLDAKSIEASSLQSRLTAKTDDLTNYVGRYGSLDSKLRTNGGTDTSIFANRLIGIHDLASLLVRSDNGGLVVATDGHVTLPAAPASTPAPAPAPDVALSTLTKLMEKATYTGGGFPKDVNKMIVNPKAKLSDLSDEGRALVLSLKAPKGATP